MSELTSSEKTILEAYRSVRIYTIVKLEDDIIILNESIKTEEDSNLVKLYKQRINEIKKVKKIIEDDIRFTL